MSKIFRSFPNRKDNRIVCFKSDDHAAILEAICCNSVTGYVVDNGSSVSVPAHAAEKIAADLVKNGWERS